MSTHGMRDKMTAIARREARESFIARFNIMSTSGRLYGPDELIGSVSRHLSKCAVGHPRRVARAWVSSDAFMRMCSGMTPSGVASEVLSRHLRGDLP